MRLEKAAIEHLAAFTVYVQACVADGLSLYEAATVDSEAYFKKRIAYAEGQQLPDGWPAISMYFCIEGERILGAIRVRHGTNPYIENVIGHIGYETLSQSRGKGVATKMLSWVKQQVIENDAIVTCDESNLASQKVIEKCGGQYLNTFYCDEDHCEVRRYQLKKL